MARALPWTGRGTPASIRVLATSPDTIFGEALSSYLDEQAGIDVVGLTFEVDRLTEAVEVLRPGVLLCDQRAASPVGPVFEDCIEVHSDLRTVLLATMAAPLSSDEAVAHAVVPPRSSLDRVVAAVREVAWHRHPAAVPVADPAPQLSDRELEVLRMLSHGEGTSDIAGALHLSPHTVRNHVSRLSGKLGTHSRIEAVTVARRHGII